MKKADNNGNNQTCDAEGCDLEAVVRLSAKNRSCYLCKNHEDDQKQWRDLLGYFKAPRTMGMIYNIGL